MANYRPSAAARADIIEILEWTDTHFGELARLRYERLLVVALRELAAEPERAGSVARPELGANVRSYHLRHSRERARHASGIVRQPRSIVSPAPI